MSTPILILYYVLLFIHVVSAVGALVIALRALIKCVPAKGLWHAALSAAIAGVALTALLSWQAEVNEMKIGVKLAVSIAVLALSLLVARREKEAAESAILADTAGPAVDVADDPGADPRLVDDEPEEPIDTIRPLLSGVIIGVIINTLLALLW